jgi:hypothetical protein
MTERYRNTSGIQNINSTVSGAQAVGAGAVASVGAPISGNALAEAVSALAAQLPSLDLPPDAAEDAAAHLEDLRAEATSGQPNGGRIRRALAGLTGLLGGLTAAAGALTSLEQAAEPLIRTLGH